MSDDLSVHFIGISQSQFCAFYLYRMSIWKNVKRFFVLEKIREFSCNFIGEIFEKNFLFDNFVLILATLIGMPNLELCV